LHLIHRKTCRVCGSSALTSVIDLGEQHLQGSFVKPGKEMPPMRKVPLRVTRCDPTRDEKACGLLQMEHSTPGDILYAAYWYRSGTNRTMRDHLTGIAREGAELAGRSGARVLDIGCNDGTLLAAYPADYAKFGVDPSDVAQTVTGATVVQDIFPSAKLAAAAGPERFDVITSIAMFYDLEQPVAFARSVGELLAKDGLWMFEMSYMPTMLAKDSYDTICHEHLEYYSLAVLERIAKDAGLRVFRIAFNDINGGSIRCYTTHANSTKHGTADDARLLSATRQAEFELALDTDARSKARLGGEAHPPLRRVDEGEHHPPVLRHRPHPHRVRGRPKSRQGRRSDARHRHSDRQRREVARLEARLLPRPPVALP
jgi:SAM-dependent methyltransferase